MKKLFFILIFIITNILSYSNTLESIMSQFDKAISIPNLYGKFSMTLISKNGETREIRAEAYQKLIEENQMNRVFVFDYPPSVRDTGLLIHSFYDDGENKMWLYLPVVKRIKRISLESSGGGFFMGSDFSYSDLISKSSKDYKQEFLEDKMIENQLCYSIKEFGENEEKTKKLGYLYTINYYTKENSFLIGRDYFELSGDLLKTYRVKEIKKFGTYIYPTLIEMENVQTSHKSIINVTDISIDELPDTYFTTRYITK